MPYADPGRQREYMRQWIAARRLAWLQENGPCIDCGSWDQLEVDHVDPSTKINHRVWSWSLKRREAELAKCVVRCRKHHHAKTLSNGEKPVGARNGATKLTVPQVLEIRASRETQRVLAVRYGVNQTQISKIKRRKNWAHIAPGPEEES